VRRARWRIQDRRLTSEQRRGLLGPAHLGWRGNSPEDQRKQWSGYDWSGRGEEWNASLEWKQALVDHVLARWIPADAAVLEIGQGAGRWSETLALRASRLVLVDVSERPLQLCRERFSGRLRSGPVPPGGKQLVLEARAPGGAWLQFKVVRTNARGRFHAGYRFRFPGPARYQFRALSEPESDYPFAAGTSNVVGVRER